MSYFNKNGTLKCPENTVGNIYLCVSIYFKIKRQHIYTHIYTSMLGLISALAWIVPAGWWVNVECRDLRLEIQVYVFI